MPYDYDDFIDAMRFGLTMSDRDTTDDIWNMVDEVVDKAKAFDEIRKYVNKKLEEEKFPIEDDYLIGRYESYEIIEEIIKENLEDK
ncbi:hypothetical protein [Mammaliicoccus sciuri]|uniref:hypothetical protein n=1 Tax=Mammaliicoccus sciuri TaxID=1296 RepID=UPI002DB73DC8|nr:hypothetical protein [Mammaliicoccus sciuri]MEB6258276.1 hypothetical protein [Mammaliicoccus sciuri]MEB8190099.1 hypothetical protein [Mammaliicoccus sciuri]